MAETRFHEGTSGRAERLTGRAQHFVNGGRNRGIVPSSKLYAAVASYGILRTHRSGRACRRRRICVAARRFGGNGRL
jgi:hypothetical protein